MGSSRNWARTPKPPPAAKPGTFGRAGPGDAFVDRASKYLAALDPRERQRLEHSFENRQDALLGRLDARGLTDDGYTCARQTLFELFAMVELGWPPGLKDAAPEVPEALALFSERALSEAESAESEAVRGAVDEGLAELWASRRRR